MLTVKRITLVVNGVTVFLIQHPPPRIVGVNLSPCAVGSHSAMNNGLK